MGFHRARTQKNYQPRALHFVAEFLWSNAYFPPRLPRNVQERWLKNAQPGKSLREVYQFVYSGTSLRPKPAPGTPRNAVLGKHYHQKVLGDDTLCQERGVVIAQPGKFLREVYKFLYSGTSLRPKPAPGTPRNAVFGKHYHQTPLRNNKMRQERGAVIKAFQCSKRTTRGRSWPWRPPGPHQRRGPTGTPGGIDRGRGGSQKRVA